MTERDPTRVELAWVSSRETRLALRHLAGHATGHRGAGRARRTISGFRARQSALGWRSSGTHGARVDDLAGVIAVALRAALVRERSAAAHETRLAREAARADFAEAKRHGRTVYAAHASAQEPIGLAQLHTPRRCRHTCMRRYFRESAKLGMVMNVVGRGPARVGVTHGSRHDVHLLKPGHWMRGRLFLLDVGFFSAVLFQRIEQPAARVVDVEARTCSAYDPANHTTTSQNIHSVNFTLRPQEGSDNDSYALTHPCRRCRPCHLRRCCRLHRLRPRPCPRSSSSRTWPG